MGVVSNPQRFLSRIAVCSWSLQASDPATLIQRMRAAGFHRVQLDLDPFREHPSVWDPAPKMFADEGIAPVSGMFRTVGEDYSTLETIRVTGGIVPDATWEQNLANARITARNAERLGLKFVMFHAGFLPHDAADPSFEKLASRVRTIARMFADHGLTLGCETGQETAESLRNFLEALGEPNVAVNFDPANMLLYGNGDPIDAVRLVGRWVRGVHMKDARVTDVPGTWGTELPVGRGQVDWPAFLRALEEIGFDGDLCFEREAENQRVEDLRAGREFIEQLLRG